MQSPKDTTSRIVHVFIQDTAYPDGRGKTGLVFNTAGLSAYYSRNSASSATAITLVTMTLGTWASGGFKEVDATNMPGVYQVGVPDAALVVGADAVVIQIKGTAILVAPLRIELTSKGLWKSTDQIIVGSAITGTLSSTQATTDLTEATDDHYKGRSIIWTSGVLVGQVSDITAYLGSSKRLTYTVTPTAEAPANGDTFILV